MIRWGIIGYGNIARRFIKSLKASPTGKLMAIASRSKTEEVQKDYPDVKIYEDYETLLADESIDVVYIALPHKLHVPLSLLALQAKKGVFTEKPAGLNAQEVLEVLTFAQKHQIFYGEALKTRYNQALSHLQHMINKGVVGPLTFMYANFCDDFSHLPANHHFFDRQQGGALLDLGSYPLGLISMFNPLELDEVQVKMELEEGIDRKTNATLFFRDGMKAHIEVSSTHIETRTAFLKGEKGMVYLQDSNRPTAYTVVTSEGTKTYEFPFTTDDMSFEIEAVNRAIQQGLIETPEYPHQDIYRISQFMDAIAQHKHKIL